MVQLTGYYGCAKNAETDSSPPFLSIVTKTLALQCGNGIEIGPLLIRAVTSKGSSPRKTGRSHRDTKGQRPNTDWYTNAYMRSHKMWNQMITAVSAPQDFWHKMMSM
jgi:hypothetical protein